MAVFDDITISKLQEKLATCLDEHAPEYRYSSITAPEGRRELQQADASLNRRLYKGDHWLDGIGWSGPTPPTGDTDSLAVVAEIRRAFVSKNAVREVVRRHVAGVVGHEPTWGLTVKRPLKEKQKPTQAEQKLIDDAEAALTSWWDERGMLVMLQKAAAELLLSGRSSLRLFVPSGMLVEGTVPTGTLDESLGRIYVERPAPGAGGVITDQATQQQCSVYLYQENGQQRAEITYIDDDGNTVIKVLSGDNERAVPLPLEKKLLMLEMTREGIITPQVREQQYQLNLAKTMQGRNVVQGGFLERTILNAQMPGKYVDDPSAPEDANGLRRRFVPETLKLGAGRTNAISGQPIRDAEGLITGYTSPSVIYRDPVSVTTFEETARSAYLSILEECQQLHAAIAGDATASGESRKQARADFETSLANTKTQVDRLVRWLLETALTLAALFSSQPDRYAGLRAVSDCRIDTGPLAGDEQQQIINQVDKKLISRETAMGRLGVEDVDAEKARIDEESAAQAERDTQNAAALAAATGKLSNQTTPEAPGQASDNNRLPEGQGPNQQTQGVQ